MRKAWGVPPPCRSLVRWRAGIFLGVGARIRGRLHSVALLIDSEGCGTWGESVPLATSAGKTEARPRPPLVARRGPAFFQWVPVRRRGTINIQLTGPSARWQAGF